MDYEFPLNEESPRPLVIQPKPKTKLQPISSDMVNGMFQKEEHAERDQSAIYPTPHTPDAVRHAPAMGQAQPKATILSAEPLDSNAPNHKAWRVVATIFFSLLLIASLFFTIPEFVAHLHKPTISSYFSIAMNGLTIVAMISLLMRREWARLIIIILCIIGILGAIPLLLIPSVALNIAIAYTVIRNVLLIGFLMITPVHIQFN